MKTKLRVLALLTSAMVLHGCGGGDMLGSSDAEDYKMTPEEVTEDLTKPRPSENAPVITTEGNNIYWADGRETIFRGINLQYSNAPLEMIDGFTGIAETGANVVRIQLSKTTSEGELEAALNAAALNGLAAIITLNDPELKCHDDEAAFNDAVSNLWLDEWLPIIAQDRYQDKIMVNMASGWGPKEVFNGYSFGYRTYMDTYKTAIRQFRKAGLKFPLVVDAPGCGEDYHAFESDRAKELMAADDQKNLIFSVHAYGSTWNNRTKINDGIAQITSQNVPVIMSEFGGSGLGEKPVKHMEILEAAAGNMALKLDVPWVDAQDKLAVAIPFEQPLNIANNELSFDLYVDKAYVDDGNMGYQLYLLDVNGTYANFQWIAASGLTGNSWNTLTYTVKSEASFNHVEEGFDLSAVAKVGVEFVSNGKAPDIVGPIKIDNLKVVEGVAELYSNSFDDPSSVASWDGAWTGTEINYAADEKAMAVTREAEKNEIVVTLNGLSKVDFNLPVDVSIRIFVPATYTSTSNYFKFFNNDGWIATNDVSGIPVGEWTEVKIPVDFKRSMTSLGIQFGGFVGDTSVYDPILFDDIKIMGVSASAAKEMGVQYQSYFEGGVDGWESYDWGGDAATVETEDGALKITPKHTGSKEARTDIGKAELTTKIEHLDFSQDPVVIKFRIKLPASYEGTDYGFTLLLQDTSWNVNATKKWLAEDLPLDEWVDLTWEVDFVNDVESGEFNREAKPQRFVFQVNGNYINDPFYIEEILIEGMVPVEKEEVVIGQIDFFDPAQFDSAEVGVGGGAITIEDLVGSITADVRSAPFSWLAWSWFGNDAEHAGWDMTTIIDSALGLTDRGIDIILGKGGIVETIGATDATTEEEEVIEE